VPTLRLTVNLPAEAETLRLGRALAVTLPSPPSAVLLLAGELGSGKTSLVRGLTLALPGGADAEVASPSFTLYNLYPTTPAVAHFDLYRLTEGRPDAEYHEWLDEIEAGRPALLALEWPERLTPDDLPADYLLVRLSPAQPGREAALEAHGQVAQEWLERVEGEYREKPVPKGSGGSPPAG
jgi:tRNA threonylcarbamoyladenosine biosynthesis protein TsaE